MSILRPLYTVSPKAQALLALMVVVIASVFIEHSWIDVAISSWFYVGQGNWLLHKEQFVFAMLFYKLPKLLLIVFGVYLLTALAYMKFTPNAQSPQWLGRAYAPLIRLGFGRSEILYIFAVLVLTPLLVAILKAVTHVPCPHELLIFSGDKPYLSLWQDIMSGQHAKCFPAAHASSGFGLYGLAFVPVLQPHRWRYVVLVSVIGWTMGLYKMMIGDHFFSHTLVSMALGWLLASGLASVFLQKN